MQQPARLCGCRGAWGPRCLCCGLSRAEHSVQHTELQHRAQHMKSAVMCKAGTGWGLGSREFPGSTMRSTRLPQEGAASCMAVMAVGCSSNKVVFRADGHHLALGFPLPLSSY